jgi:hypothetical protein
MAEKKYKTPAGNIYTESELRKKYPDQFDSLVSNNKLTLVSDEGDVTEEEEEVVEEPAVEEPVVEEPAVEEPVVEKAEAPIPDYGSYLGYTPPAITTDQLGDATKTSGDVFLQELEKRKKTIFKEEAELSERLGEIEKQKRAELLEEEEAQQKKSTEIRESEKFKSVLDGIDKSLIKQEEEIVVPQLKEDFIDYGFVFEETGIGDALTVTTNDGKNSIVIDLDPFTESGAEKETKRLKDFLSSNVSFERKEEKVIEGTSKAESFYKNRNLNYQAEKNSYDEYVKVRDEIDRIEEIKNLGFDLGTQADEAAYYTDLSDLKEKESALFDVVMRDEAKETREGYDQYISGLIKLSMDKANDVYISAENKQADLDVYSKETFGVGLDGLQTYKAKSQEEVDVINDIFNDYNKSNAEKRLAQDKYDLAISYFDTQVDKQIEQEYSENLSGFLNEFDKGLQQGLAAEVILMSALGIGYDMDDQDSRMQAAKKIYTHLSKNPGASSKVLSQYNKAVGAKETADILFNDPFELMTTLAASSLSMMLPYGYKIVGSTTLLGAGIGTGAGAAFAGVGALPGFITGTAKGFQTGMSATSLAMEYTNEVLDAAREKYDIMNDPTGEEMAKALADPEVWATGKERGLKRGIPIAVMDLISGQLAGKIFTAGKFSGVGARVGAQIVERAVFDPLAEAAGEALAQTVVGDDLEYKEILSESLGSVGNNTTNMAVNLGLEAALNKNKALGKNLMMADFVAKESASDETIANWANRREKAGKMSKEDNQKIQKNVATRREARQLLDVGEKKSRKNSKVLSRTMILLNTKEILSSDPVRKSTFSKLIKEISNELEVIATTKKLSDKPVDVSAFVKEAVIEQVTTKSKPKYEKPTMFTTTTPEKYGTVNRQDGKGEVVLTEEEYNAEMEKFAPVEEVTPTEEAVVEEAAPVDVVEGAVPEVGEVVYHGSPTDIEGGVLKKGVSGAIFLTPSRKYAESYAPQGTGSVTEFTISEEKKNNLFDIRNEEHIERLKEGFINNNEDLEIEYDSEEDALRDYDNAIRSMKEASEGREGVNDWASGSQFIEAMENAGFEGALFAERPAGLISEDVVLSYALFDNELEIKKAQDAVQKSSTETTAEAIPEPIKKATKEDRDAFDAGTMDEERTGGIISDIADRIISGRKLTPFLKRFQEKNKEKVEEMISFKSEVSDLEASINETFEQVNNAVDGKPRMRKGEDEVAAEDYVDLVSVIKEMNELDPRLVNYTTPKLSEDIEVSPISEATDTSPIPQEILDFYGVKDATEFEKSIEEFEGIPMVRGGMTDMLGGGKVKDSMGNDMEIGGGIMFSLRNIANKGLAWAGIDKTGANTQYKDAVKLYNDNKALFERLWKEERLPNGHIPMTITKMADSGVNSNEAVFRYVLPKLKSVPLENRKKSFDALMDRMFSKRTKKDGTVLPPLISEKEVKEGEEKKIPRAKKVRSLIETYKVTTMDGFFEAIVKDANLRAKDETKAILTLDDRSAIFNIIFSKGAKTTKTGKPAIGNNLPHSKALFEGIEKDPYLLNAENVYDAIAEKSVKDTPKGYVVAVVGIDVLNGGVTKASHTNYGFGPKGRLIGLITNPRHQADIFPEQTARAAGQAKLKKSEKTGEVTMTSDKTILGQALGNFFNMNVAQGQKARVKPDTTQQLIGLMRLTFPSVQAYTSQAEFDNILQEEGVREHLVDGVPVLGLTKDGKIYINPSQPSINTPIHEFGHIWTDMLRSSKKGRELLAKGLSMVDSDPKAYEAAKRKYAEYDADGNITNEELVREEALVSMIAAKGEGIVDAAQKSNFKNWLKGVMEYVKKNFKGTFEAIGTGKNKKVKSIINDKMVEELSLDGFLNMAIADLLSGEVSAVQPEKSPTPQESRAKMSKKQTESLESSSVRFSKGSDVSMSSIINEGRRLGFSEKAIKEILRRRKFKVSDINKALEVSIDLLTPLPPEFGDIEGGVEAGEKLYRSVRKKLGSFVKRGIKDSEGKRRDVSFSETQRKAIELLKQDAVFKNQPEVTQKALIVAMDASLNVDNNNPVSSEIGAIKASLSKLDTKKQGKREVKELQTRLKNFIRKSLIKSDNYSQADINKLIRTVVDIDSITFNEKAIADFQISAQKALEVVEKQRDRKKNKTISKIISRVKKGAQKKRGSGSAAGKVKAGVTEQEGQVFFAQAQKILEAVKNGTVDEVRKSLNEPEILEIIENAIVKENNGESLTQKEKTLLNRAYALDTFGNIMNMEIEALEAMLESVNDVRKFSALQLRSRRQARTLENAELNSEGTRQIEKGFPSLFKTIGLENKKGTTKKVLKDDNERNSDKKAIANEFKKGKVFSSIAKVTKRIMEFRTNPIDFALRGNIYHLGTLTNILDRGGNFLTKNIYDALNNANEVKLQGFDNQMDFLNSIAETFDGIKGTPLNPAYRQFKNKLNKKELNIGKIRDKEGFLEENETMLTTQQAMRLYALSKNPVQRAKLEAMGIGKETMSQIIAHIGKDAVTLVDATVDYLSNDYFESINSVYSQTNDVNLNYVENYFPTRSVMDGTTEVSEQGLDFSKQFTAENESALNKRVDMSSPILVSQSFDVALDAYFDSMENYKAHAVTVKKINAIFKNKAVAALLKETGLKDLMRSQINYAINGTTPYQVAAKAGVLWTSFVGVALGLKAIQILKQATSFVQAFEDYSFRGQGKKKIPGLDLMMFMLDGAYTYATFPLQIKKAWGVSATFRDRLRRGLDGDVYGLESGRNQYKLVSQNNNKLKAIKRGWRALTVAPTVFGDVLGVLGYMINYNRNIKNGMSKAEAVEKLNNYNATQQTRRNTEVSQISQNKNVLIRVFTTFGSTLFLQINNVSQAFTNIMRGMKKGEKVKAKDIRKLALNMSIANGLFVGASNIAKIIKGDEDDREEVMHEMIKALTGLNLLFGVPLIGVAAEGAYDAARGQKVYAGGGINPYADFVNKFRKALNSEEVTLEASKVITSIMIKANVDPIVAVYNGFVTDEGFDAKTVMELIGISPSYRPAESSGSAAPLERTLDDMVQDGDFDDIDTNVDIDTDFETNVDF